MRRLLGKVGFRRMTPAEREAMPHFWMFVVGVFMVVSIFMIVDVLDSAFPQLRLIEPKDNGLVAMIMSACICVGALVFAVWKVSRDPFIRDIQERAKRERKELDL